jgi:hypothetical protein
LDGSDPRQFGGSLARGAIRYDGSPVTVVDGTVVKARILQNGEWSALTGAEFIVSMAMVPQAGDANRDNQFDQSDLVRVLQAGKYLTAQPAGWQNGDWNGNGLFDQLDLVLALQTGNYLQQPYPAQDLGGSVLAKQAAFHPTRDWLDALFADIDKL